MADAVTPIGIPGARALPTDSTETLYFVKVEAIAYRTDTALENVGLDGNKPLVTEQGHYFAFTLQELECVLNRLECIAYSFEPFVCELYDHCTHVEITSRRSLHRHGSKAFGSDVPTIPVYRGRCEVSDTGWDGNGQVLFQAMTSHVLAPVVQSDIVLSVPHKRPHAHQELPFRLFQIFIWSSPNESMYGSRAPERMWNIEVGCRDEPFLPSGLGIPILDSRGYAVAELFQQSLYIHHDICHEGSMTELRLFRKILEKACALLKSLPDAASWDAFQKEQATALMSKRLTHFCAGYVGQQKDRLQQNLELVDARIAEYRRELVDSLRKQSALATRLSVFDDQQMVVAFGEDIEKIKAIDGVRVVDVQGESLVVNLGRRFCIDRATGKRHRFGICTAFIDLRSGQVAVHTDVKAPDARYEGRVILPHCTHDRVLYWGDLEVDVLEYIAAFEVATVVEFIVAVLSEANSRGQTDRILSFPIVREKKKVSKTVKKVAA